MTVAVIGSGAVGTWVGACLASHGRSVVVCSRRPFEELVLDDRGTERRARVPVLTDPGDASPAEHVLLTTKAHQVPGASGWLRSLCRSGTTLSVLQNGVDHAERVAPYAGAATVVPALVWAEVEPEAPGRAVHRGPGRLEVPAEAIPSLGPLFDGTPVELRGVDDLVTAAWRKLCGNVAANGITALTGRRLEVVGEPGIADLARGLVAECVAVGRAEGADLDAAVAETIVEGMARHVGGHTSMLADRLAGRPLEHDAIYGAVERAGRRYGIPTPLTSLVLSLLRAASPDP